MNIFYKFRFFMLALPLLFVLAACGAPSSTSEGTVQDIQPGDQSVIQPPSGAQPVQESGLEERSL